MPKISMIAAIASENRALGKNGRLIYYIPEDLKRFKKITSGHPIIMGRKTFESIGQPLPNRTNIVITHDENYFVEDTIIVHSLEEAFRLSSLAQAFGSEAQARRGDDEIFVIGGGEIYKQAIGMADKLYLTIIEGNPPADTFFPDYSEFKRVISESQWQEHEGTKFKFLELEKESK